MRVNLRNTFLILALTSGIFVISLYGQAWSKRNDLPRAAAIWKSVGAGCLPFMIITLAYGSLGLLDRHRDRRE